LALLAGQVQHPVARQTFTQLWQQAQIEQDLWPLAFTWREQSLTPKNLLKASAV